MSKECFQLTNWHQEASTMEVEFSLNGAVMETVSTQAYSTRHVALLFFT